MVSRRRFIQVGFAGVGALSLFACASQKRASLQSFEAKFDQNRKIDPNRPQIPERQAFNIRDYGAVGDGNTLNTAAIQQTIDAASANSGGGKVIVPEGVFLSGSIELKSNIEFHLSPGSLLLGSTDVYQYNRTERGWFSLVHANNAENIAITGTGTIDGQGRELALAIDHLHHSGTRPLSNYNQRRMRPPESERPQAIEFLHCKHVYIYDVSVRNAASWVQTYERCEDLVIDSIKVVSDAYWNNDGIDIENCHKVRITNCYVNAADDAICIKSSKGDGYNDDVYVGQCVVRSSSNGLKLGTSSKGGYKNILMEDVEVFDTYRSAICLGCVDGGFIENVTIRNIRATNTANAFVIRLGHRNTEGKVGTIKNVSIKNIEVDIPFGRTDSAYDMRGPALNTFFNPIPASITGLPGQFVQDIVLEDIEISYPGNANNGLAYIPLDQLFQVPEQRSEYPEYSMFGELPSWALYVRHAMGISVKDMRLTVKEPDFRPAFVFDDASDISLSDVRVQASHSDPQIVFNNTSREKVASVEFYPNNQAPVLRL